MNENPTINHTIRPGFRKDLRTVLSAYLEDIGNVKGASRQGEQRQLQFPHRSLDPPAPDVADGASAPVDPLLQDLPARPRLRSRARARARRPRKRNGESGCA